MQTDSKKIPLTLISGFLGAGKTTLINYWLAEGFGDQAVAVIVNDFGKISVDTSLIKTQSQNILELHNGCVCCTLAGDLTRGLGRLLNQGAFDRILMETSGITQMTPLLKILQSPALVDRILLEKVVILVDAVRHSAIRKVVLTVDEQVRNAHVILINRSDLANDTQLQATRAALAEVNPMVDRIETEFCQVPFSRIADVLITENSSLLHVDSHGPNWSTCRLVFDRPINHHELQSLLDALPESVLRAKGFLQNDAGVYLELQRVGQDNHLREVKVLDDAALINVLVAIGPEGMQAELESVLKQFPEVRVESDTVTAQHDHN